MVVEIHDGLVIVTRDTLANSLKRSLKGGLCPLCGTYFKPNGTGPDGDKFTHWALRLMPWDDILQELAVPLHDWRCHVGAHEFNLSFKDTTAEFRKNVMEAVIKWCRKRWWRRWLYKPCFSRLDEIYAYAVGKTEAGREAYDQNSCLI